MRITAKQLSRIERTMYPAYTTAQLEQVVAEIKANETGSDACMRMIAMQDEIDRRKSIICGSTGWDNKDGPFAQIYAEEEK